jgi:RNA 3'-terminal phosphate cyclase (ATP)
MTYNAVSGSLVVARSTNPPLVQVPDPTGIVLQVGNPNPVITSALTATAALGSSFDYFITATTNPFIFNATGLPAGLVVDPATGHISGSPTESGNFNVTISATSTSGTGSATLVLQTVLPSLLTASGRSTLTLEGGTHNPLAPPFDFLARSFMPLLHRMGAGVELELRAPGFYPAGGGRFHVRIEPVKRLRPITLIERGPIRSRRARVWLSKLSSEIAERELAIVREELRWQAEECSVETVAHPKGPGNALVLEIETEHVTAVFTGFGERGRPAEDVAREAVEAAKLWLAADVPVDEYLADQLLLPMILGGRGFFRTTKPSLHATTNAAIIQRFISVPIQFEEESQQTWTVSVADGQQ